MKTQLKKTPPLLRMIIIALFQMIWFETSAYNVTQLKASYKNGQVCLAWNSPQVTNLKYNVYRSKTQFTSSSQFTPENYIGSVRDSSSKNMRRSRISQTPIYYKWDEDGYYFSADVGIYVVTCNEEATFYYAVTITDLETGAEDLYFKVNKNVTYAGCEEYISNPQPVLQDTVTWNSGEVAFMYVQFGNNQDVITQPAFNNCGSYGYNFYLVKRGNTDSQAPIYVFYEGLEGNSVVGNGLDAFADVTDCYIMGMDDWTPYPDGYGTDAGKGTSWVGYHENYDMYSKDNSVPTTGVVKAYTQTRLIYSINWARKYLPNADSNKVYLVGVSAGGYGVLLTANLIPDKIATVYSIVSPARLESGDGSHEPMWGSEGSNLYSDLLNPATQSQMRIFDAMNNKYLLVNNSDHSLPPIYTVHGRKDNTIGWKDKPGFFDTVQISKQGGVMFWDGREHDGSKALFLDSETMPDFTKYSCNLSFPAFSNCTINQDPGTGKKKEGESYGAINGFMGWDNVNDQSCDYSVHLFVKDFYAGGILDADQKNEGVTDVTLRRIQQFKPDVNENISWSNTASDGSVLQSGTFIYSGATITLTGLTVDKEGNTLELKYGDCAREFAASSSKDNYSIRYVRIANGWEVHLNSLQSEVAKLSVYSDIGQVLQQRELQLNAGENIFNIDLLHNGIYLVEVKGNNNSQVTKLVY